MSVHEQGEAREVPPILVDQAVGPTDDVASPVADHERGAPDERQLGRNTDGRDVL
jgi:hypothetical protein